MLTCVALLYLSKLEVWLHLFTSHGSIVIVIVWSCCHFYISFDWLVWCETTTIISFAHCFRCVCLMFSAWFLYFVMNMSDVILLPVSWYICPQEEVIHRVTPRMYMNFKGRIYLKFPRRFHLNCCLLFFLFLLSMVFGFVLSR